MAPPRVRSIAMKSGQKVVVKETREEGAPAIHAEQNALIYAVKNHTPVDGATLYVTLSPCLSCARIILTMGIKRVVYLKSYSAYKKLEKDEGVDFLLEFGMEVEAYKGQISTLADSLI